MRVVVGRVGRPHGVRGEVTVEVRTDDPGRRFAPGALLFSGEQPVTVAAARWHRGRMLLSLVGVDDRTGAETLRGRELSVDVDPAARPGDPEEFYDHQLIGLRAHTPGGEQLGEVAEVLHLPAQDVLVLRRPYGAEALVPFVRAVVPVVDLDAGMLVVDPPAGLLDAEE